MAKRTGKSAKKATRKLVRAPMRAPERTPEYRRDWQRVRNDGWANILSGLGTERDRRSYTSFVSEVLSDLDVMHMWRTEDLVARIIELPPCEALAPGYDLKFKDKELAESVVDAAEELGVDGRIRAGREMERAYGGSALLPWFTEAGNIAEPIDDENLHELTAFHVLEPRELWPAAYYSDISSPKFGMPEIYRVQPILGNGYSAAASFANIYIHESRLIVFPGLRISRQPLPGQRFGWGDSVISRPFRVLADFGTSWGSAATILADFAQGVYEMDGLAQTAALEGGEEIIKKRFAIMDMMRSTLRSMVIDGKDKFSRTSTPVSGLEGLLQQFATRMSASVGWPTTKLLGMAPAGMNATGESDTRSWYDLLGGERAHMRPRHERALQLIMLDKEGPTGGEEPDVWSLEYKPLWAPTEKEREEARYQRALSDKIYIEDQVVTSDEVRKARFVGDTFSYELQVEGEYPAPPPPTPEEIAAMQALNSQAGIDRPGQKQLAPGESPADATSNPTDPEMAQKVAGNETPAQAAARRQVMVREHARNISDRSGGRQDEMIPAVYDIVHRNDGWCVVNEAGTNIAGPFRSENSARTQFGYIKKFATSYGIDVTLKK